MYDCSTDALKESVMDFMISWILRFAQTEYKNSNLQIHNYGRKLLGLIIQVSEVAMLPSDSYKIPRNG